MEDSAYTSGIHCSINAALPAFKNFQRITPSHRIHAPFSTKDTRNRCCFLLSFKRKRLPADKSRISKEDEGGALLEPTGTVPAAEQLQLEFHYLPVPVPFFFSVTFPPHLLLKSCICREDSLRSAQKEKTAERLFERLSARECGWLR